MDCLFSRVLSNAHPVHEELLLLVFARDHNKRHCCSVAAEKYRAGQARGEKVKVRAAPTPASGSQLSTADGEVACAMPKHGRRGRKRQALSSTCGGHAPQDLSVAASTVSVDASAAIALPGTAVNQGIAKADLHSTHVWIHPQRKTVHHAVLRDSVSAGCGYFFGQSQKPQLLDKADVVGRWACGSCYGWRAKIHE